MPRQTRPTRSAAIGRAAAEEWVEDEVAASRAIQEGIGDQGDRLYRWVDRGKLPFLVLSPEIVGTRVMPDIAAVAAMLTQFDVIPVRCPAVFEDEDQFVLAPVQRAHAGVVLDPDAQVFVLGVDSERGR